MELNLRKALEKAAKPPQVPMDTQMLQRKQMEKAAEFSKMFWSHQQTAKVAVK